MDPTLEKKKGADMHKINVRPLACFLSLAVITAFVTPITVNSIALTTEHVAEMADDNPSNIGITRSIEDKIGRASCRERV